MIGPASYRPTPRPNRPGAAGTLSGMAVLYWPAMKDGDIEGEIDDLARIVVDGFMSGDR
jgi:hypothetical protein